MRRNLSELLFTKNNEVIHNFLNEEKRLFAEATINRTQTIQMIRQLVTGLNSKNPNIFQTQQSINKLMDIPIAGFNINAVGSKVNANPEDKISKAEFDLFFKKWDMIPFIIEDAKSNQEITAQINNEVYHIITFIPKLNEPIKNDKEVLELHKLIFNIEKIPESGYTYSYSKMKSLPIFIVSDDELDKIKVSFKSGTKVGLKDMVNKNIGNKRLMSLSNNNKKD